MKLHLQITHTLVVVWILKLSQFRSVPKPNSSRESSLGDLDFRTKREGVRLNCPLKLRRGRTKVKSKLPSRKLMAQKKFLSLTCSDIQLIKVSISRPALYSTKVGQQLQLEIVITTCLLDAICRSYATVIVVTDEQFHSLTSPWHTDSAPQKKLKLESWDLDELYQNQIDPCVAQISVRMRLHMEHFGRACD